MNYIQSLLAHGERIVFASREHWLALLPTVLIDLLLVVLVVTLSVGGFFLSPPLTLWGLFLLLVPLGHFAVVLVNWLNESYIVTNRRVMEVKGVWKKHVSDSSLEKVNDVVMEQSALGRLLNYGDVRVITGSDVGVNAFQRIAHPIRFKVAMLDQKSGMATATAARSLQIDPTQVPQLLGQLDELRQRKVITEEEFAQEKAQLLKRLQ